MTANEGPFGFQIRCSPGLPNANTKGNNNSDANRRLNGTYCGETTLLVELVGHVLDAAQVQFAGAQNGQLVDAMKIGG